MEKHNAELRPVKDNFPFGIISTAILLVIFLIVYIILCIQHDIRFTVLFDLKRFDPALFIFSVMILDIFFSGLKYCIYCINKKLILYRGKISRGTIVDTTEVPVRSIRGKHVTHYNYIYGVRLDNGKLVYTDQYEVDLVKKYRFSSCTVHEYRGRYVFSEFRR